MGKSATYTGKETFKGDKDLVKVTILDSVTELPDDCFAGCSNLTEVTIPSSVMVLGDRCFDGCSNLTEVTIPSSVTKLGRYCFDGCSNLLPPELAAKDADPGKVLAYLKEKSRKKRATFLFCLKHAQSDFYNRTGDPCGASRRIIMEFVGLFPA